MKKLRKNKGFTMAELLIAVAVLAVFVSMAIVGTSALFGTGEQMSAVAKAAVLGSDVMKAVTNEVRFGENFSASDTSITYNSTTYGDGCFISLDEQGQLVIVQTSKAAGNEGGLVESKKNFYPIGSAAYDEVRIKSIVFSIDETSGREGEAPRQAITCTLSITANGTDVLWEKAATVVPLAQKV